MKNNKTIITIILSLLVFMSVSVSFAYWSGTVEDSDETTNISVKIGDWIWKDQTPSAMFNGAIDYFNDIKVLPKPEDQDNKDVYLTNENIHVSQFSSLLVYHSGIGKYFVLNSPATMCEQWIEGGCYNPSDRKNIQMRAYRHVDINYYNSIYYYIGDVVYYVGEDNVGQYFIVGNDGSANATDTVPKPGETWDPWVLFNNLYDSNVTYNKNTKVLYNDDVYIALSDGVTVAPGGDQGVWNKYKSLDFVLNNTYFEDDIVLYQGSFYRAKTNNVFKVLPTNTEYWMLADIPNRPYKPR